MVLHGADIHTKTAFHQPPNCTYVQHAALANVATIRLASLREYFWCFIDISVLFIWTYMSAQSIINCDCNRFFTTIENRKKWTHCLFGLRASLCVNGSFLSGRIIEKIA